MEAVSASMRGASRNGWIKTAAKVCRLRRHKAEGQGLGIRVSLP